MFHGHQGHRGLGEPPRLTHFNDHMLSPSQCLEEQAIEEESKGQLNFLFACQAALPSQACGTLWHAGSFQPRIDGTGTDIPPI